MNKIQQLARFSEQQEACILKGFSRYNDTHVPASERKSIYLAITEADISNINHINNVDGVDGAAAINGSRNGKGNEKVSGTENGTANPNELLGALEAVIFYDWMSINRLWVSESCRLQGLGKSLMLKAQDIAIENSCIGCYLNTFDFQARGFYEKLGFSVFGTLDDCPSGRQRFFMKKIITSTT